MLEQYLIFSVNSTTEFYKHKIIFEKYLSLIQVGLSELRARNGYKG